MVEDFSIKLNDLYACDRILTQFRHLVHDDMQESHARDRGSEYEGLRDLDSLISVCS